MYLLNPIFVLSFVFLTNLYLWLRSIMDPSILPKLVSKCEHSQLRNCVLAHISQARVGFQAAWDRAPSTTSNS